KAVESLQSTVEKRSLVRAHDPSLFVDPYARGHVDHVVKFGSQVLLVNVPTGVWIDEKGRIVRPNEVAFIDDRFKSFTGLDSAPYLSALRDWVEKGDKSGYAMSEQRLQEKLTPPDPNALLASAEFGLGEHLYESGHLTEAIPHFKEAQRLNPKSWNYKRQAYKLSSESDYGTTFMKEVEKAGGSKVYYAPPDLPNAGDAQQKKP